MSGNGHQADPQDSRDPDDADYYHCECECIEFHVVRVEGRTLLRCVECGLYHDPQNLGEDVR